MSGVECVIESHLIAADDTCFSLDFHVEIKRHDMDNLDRGCHLHFMLAIDLQAILRFRTGPKYGTTK